VKTSLISVVIPTYNAERKKDLLQCLDSLSQQKFQDLEIVLVVEESIALLNDLKQYFEHSQIKHRIIFSKGIKGISYARNLGVRNCSGEIIAFTDDDAVLPPEWATMLLETFNQHPEAIGVTGRVIPLWVGGSQDWLPKSLYWMIGCTGWRDSEYVRETNIAAGVNMAFRADTFNLLKFREDLGAGAQSSGKMWFPNEDNDFAIHVTSITRKPIIYNPRVIVFHKVYPHRLSYRYIRKYAFWQGAAEARYSVTWYSKRRLATKVAVFRQLLLEFFVSDTSRKRTGIGMKMRLYLFTLFFLTAGYVTYFLRIHRYNQ